MSLFFKANYLIKLYYSKKLLKYKLSRSYAPTYFLSNLGKQNLIYSCLKTHKINSQKNCLAIGIAKQSKKTNNRVL